VVRVIPGFKRNNELSLADYAHCLGFTDTFSNTTTSNASVLSYTWNFGDGSSAFQLSPNHLYQIPGNFTVNLIAKDFNVGCTNDISKTMTVYPSPSASISVEDLACPDSLFLVQGGGLPGLPGALSGTVSSPQSNFPVSFNTNNTFSLSATAPVTTVFTLNVMDNNGCKNTPVTDTIHIQAPPPTLHTSTTVIIGQTVSINAFAGSNYTYTWTPLVTDLNYTTNPYYPVSSSTVNITYSVTLIDQPLACFERVSTHDVIVQLVASLDVPTAFTPNGDGTNDVIYPGGWGIRKLIYFKIFNRWGQLIFESNDINIGWDGTFNAVPQNMETYVYQVSVDTYTNETLNKTGTFKLIR
jgi:gliding motility-associated-like protein